MDLIEINRLVIDTQNEMNSFNGGRAAAATRARKSLLLIKKQSDQLRKSILIEQKSKKEPKAKKEPKEVKEVPVAEAPAQENKEENKVQEKPKKKVRFIEEKKISLSDEEFDEEEV